MESEKKKKHANDAPKQKTYDSDFRRINLSVDKREGKTPLEVKRNRKDRDKVKETNQSDVAIMDEDEDEDENEILD